MANDTSPFSRIPEFHGDVGLYRDWHRRVDVYRASQTDDSGTLTAPRMLAALRGDAHEATRHLPPEGLRNRGVEGLKNLLGFSDGRYAWQPESLLYEAMAAYLYFAARKANESVTGFLARYNSALARFQQIVNERREAEAKQKHAQNMVVFQ